MKKRPVFTLFLVVVTFSSLLTACRDSGLGVDRGLETTVSDSNSLLPSAAPIATLTPLQPTPTVNRPGADGTVGAFLEAMQAGDYGTMYAWTTPSTQVIIDPDGFAKRYRQALAATGVV